MNKINHLLRSYFQVIALTKYKKKKKNLCSALPAQGTIVLKILFESTILKKIGFKIMVLKKKHVFACKYIDFGQDRCNDPYLTM